MASLLAQQLRRLQLDDVPNLAPKAAQFFDQICLRIVHPKNKMLMLCRQTIAIQLACESLSVEFNEVGAISMSAVSERSYRACVQETRVALGLNKNITLEELDVQFGPPQGVIEYSRRLLEEFKQGFSATISAVVCRAMDWSNSVYIAAAFYLVCKHLKKRVVAKPKLILLASAKASVFESAVSQLEKFGKSTLAEIDSGCISVPRTPARKRTRDEGNAQSAKSSAAVATSSTPAPRARRATTVAHTKAAAPAIADEVGSALLKRGRERPDDQAPSTVPRRTTRVKRAPPEEQTPKHAAPTLAAEESRPKKRARLTAKPAATAAKKSKPSSSPRAMGRPRIGIVSMVSSRH
ncbi:hypothetical protein GQ54DRAFT_55288 [Martensiomyces pterosporus]|nr:hypothetical protein GQ54DRAFT_55288 [Martensiomyces pterosporus]